MPVRDPGPGQLDLDRTPAAVGMHHYGVDLIAVGIPVVLDPSPESTRQHRQIVVNRALEQGARGRRGLSQRGQWLLEGDRGQRGIGQVQFRGGPEPGPRAQLRRPGLLPLDDENPGQQVHVAADGRGRQVRCDRREIPGQGLEGDGGGAARGDGGEQRLDHRG